jgi:quinol monooxygenase YgiN
MMIAALLGATAQPAPVQTQHSVVELRQYKIVHGQRDAFISLFDREFVETQEAEGMTLIGQFRDQADPDRFTWIRAFPNMEARQKSLTAFYTGPVWLQHRGTANPMLFDNDNVLLLRPASPDSGFRLHRPRAAQGKAAPAGMVVLTIHYLWRQPDEGFTTFFTNQYGPALQRAGLPIEAALVREEAANNFPRLPVREGEKLFVWATRVDSEAAWQAALARLHQDKQWPNIQKQLFDLEERPAQRLLLHPTPRSRLR